VDLKEAVLKMAQWYWSYGYLKENGEVKVRETQEVTA